MPYVATTIPNVNNCFGGSGIQDWEMARSLGRLSTGVGSYYLTQITINLYLNSTTNLVATRSITFSGGGLLITTNPLDLDQVLDIQPQYPAVPGNTYYLEWVDTITRT
jgi:hypothetical protein